MFNQMTSGLRGDGSTSIGRLGSQRCDVGTRCAGRLSRLPLVSRLCRLLRLAPPPPPLPPTPALAPARPPRAAGAQMGSARRRERGWQRAHETVCVGAGLVHGPHRMPRLVRALPRRQHASAERFGQGRSAAQLRGQRSAQSVAVHLELAQTTQLPQLRRHRPGEAHVNQPERAQLGELAEPGGYRSRESRARKGGRQQPRKELSEPCGYSAYDPARDDPVCLLFRCSLG
mmetsp:Transcript_5027/g.14639  ORF Transcript_5027/g.14639 Transcript_5027/m.14639 type:complete len:230 (-) Transcript_5027:567-1256(-)